MERTCSYRPLRKCASKKAFGARFACHRHSHRRPLQARRQERACRWAGCSLRCRSSRKAVSSFAILLGGYPEQGRKIQRNPSPPVFPGDPTRADTLALRDPIGACPFPSLGTTAESLSRPLLRTRRRSRLKRPATRYGARGRRMRSYRFPPIVCHPRPASGGMGRCRRKPRRRGAEVNPPR